MNVITKLFLALVLLSTFAFGQDVSCEGADCSEQKPQIEIHTSQSDVSKAAIGLPGGVNLGSGGTQGQSATDYLRSGQLRSTESQNNMPSGSLICPGPACPKFAPEPKTEFQKFVFTDTGQTLNSFGRNLFEMAPSTFAPVDRVPVPADYVIGPGDELMVRAWGQIDFSAQITVDRNGQVYLPKVGAINVAGIRYDQLTAYLKNNIGRVFKNFDVNVTLGQLRSIQVFVVGQARRPGNYTVGSLSTLVNVLFASGGPSATGTMRHIQLKRHDKVVTEFDIYDLLAKGDKSHDAVLLPGDVIYIPPVGKQVAILGSVNLPGIYEIDTETTVNSQIELAGGLSTTADGTRVIIERIDNRTSRKVEELKLDDSGSSRKLQDGDIVQIFPVTPRINDMVMLRGNVASPGKYPWRAGMRISDLIPAKESIITRDYWVRQNSLSKSNSGWLDAGNPTEDPKDAQVKKERQESKVWSDGPIENTSTNIHRNPAEINWDYAVIQRMNPQDLSSQLVTFSLGKAITGGSTEDNVVLQPGDVITIFSQTDLAVPVEKRTKFVWVEGEVRAAGVYRLEPGETLRSVVSRAGGLTTNAYLFASELLRVSTRQMQQERLQEFINDLEKELQTKGASILAGASGSGDEAVAAREQLEAQQRLIDRLKRVKADGRIVLEIKPDDNSIDALPDLALEDGDHIVIPNKPATVMVVGAVYNQNAFMFRPGVVLSKYLNQAGGPTREADRDRMYVIRADGSVVSSQQHRSIWSGGFASLQLTPGDTIVMPQRIRTSNSLRAFRDWTQVFAQLALGAAAIAVIGK